MSRIIKISIQDTDSNQTISAETSIEGISELYEKHNINGLTEIIITINQQLNEKTGIDVKFPFGSCLSNPPEGTKW